MFGPIVGAKPGPGGYAELPFYLLANPEGQRYLETGKPNLVNDSLNKLNMSNNVADKPTRDAVWSKLAAYF